MHDEQSTFYNIKKSRMLKKINFIMQHIWMNYHKKKMLQIIKIKTWNLWVFLD